ncbi:DNA-binding MarR family transcriptional regulator [Micrococcus cohnii]|uniref:DNA-binding MarR family transcriptional regulator n=1 Tax=Micrococcus cohnii TaxID=993416 RepID=A0A7W7GQD2_9MICC|nr:MarR family transcriptional regulator [Micrococcus cohnii]MBB4736349.1 DNA-binding MarR family transcriptional regulator [Micrococcus cohnii]
MSATRSGELEDAIHGLESAFSALTRQYRRLLAVQARQLSPGFSAAAMKAFVTIAHAAPITPSAVAEALTVDRAQVSRLLRDLDTEGLIARDPDPHDRRQTLLRLTDEGAARLAAVREGPTGGGLRRDLAAWDPADIRRLTELLERFVAERAARAGDDHGEESDA